MADCKSVQATLQATREKLKQVVHTMRGSSKKAQTQHADAAGEAAVVKQAVTTAADTQSVRSGLNSPVLETASPTPRPQGDQKQFPVLDEVLADFAAEICLPYTPVRTGKGDHRSEPYDEPIP